jgi:hypothetical protein
LTRSIRLEKGAVDVTVPSVGEPTAVSVRGPSTLSGVVKEGSASYVVDDERTTVAARTGEMLVGIGKEWRALPEGSARTLSRETPHAPARPIIGPPTPRAERAFAVVPEGKTGALTAAWAPIADAARYSLALDRVSDAGTTRVRVESTTDTRATLAGLEPGSYTLAVAAVDPAGLQSASSAPLPLRVLGFALPEGATVTDDGALLLGKNQRVTLLGAENVEVSYGRSPEFVAAPPSLGLARGEETRVRLRARGDTAETELRLAARALRARVELSPRAARWPGDPLTIAVELYDAGGRPVPEGTTVTPTVTVNSIPREVKWELTGRKLKCVLPPASVEGPWVVRVEVRDAQGELLGRDFLEIAPAAPSRSAIASR